jgi:hypothetical protein
LHAFLLRGWLYYQFVLIFVICNRHSFTPAPKQHSRRKEKKSKEKKSKEKKSKEKKSKSDEPNIPVGKATPSEVTHTVGKARVT